MEDYFKSGKIDNPLNIKRVGGDIPTTKNSSKNVLILIAAISIMALTLNKVWAFVLLYLKSPAFTIFFLIVTYSIIIFKVLSVTVLEEKKQKKAYRDFLDNRFSDLSLMWEIQDIKDTDISGESVAYIDYIDGTRTAFLRCVPGSVLNQDEDTPVYHYSAFEKVLDYLDDLGYTWHVHVIEEPVTDEKTLSFYYENLKHYVDEEFIDIFTEQLDTIAYVSELRSAVHVTYIEIIGIGKYRHNFLENLVALPEIMGDNHIFKEVGLLRTKAEIDKWISFTNSVSMFDREELIMNKYKGTHNLNLTSVLAAFDDNGGLIKQFNKDFDVKKIVKKRSVEANKVSKTMERAPKVSQSGLDMLDLTEMKEISLTGLDQSKHGKLIELMYSNDKVKLGD